MYFNDNFPNFLKTKYSIICVITEEKKWLEYYINNFKITNNIKDIYYWDFIIGYHNKNYKNIDVAVRAQNNPIKALEFIESLNSNNHIIFILKDFNTFLNDFATNRKIRNLSSKSKVNGNKSIIITSTSIDIPISLTNIITIIYFPLPTKTEIKKEILRLLSFLQQDIIINTKTLDLIISAWQWLTINKIRYIFIQIILKTKCFNENSIKLIIQQKYKYINHNNILELCKNTTYLKDIGGITLLKEWLHKRSHTFSIQSDNYSLPFPKSLLLVGIQRTRKSLTAKNSIRMEFIVIKTRYRSNISWNFRRIRSSG